ncbi:unnamed protein product [Caenorhabditis auriculariae]|uniref:DNA 3'-5' helicase n=1 Tax=Caenorhabditis auriculariae TaxID=2777116 RepID=A0A8S1H4V5_9PELO|nr:unnamed protein product [Caenorhabditis auriculariae]
MNEPTNSKLSAELSAIDEQLAAVEKELQQLRRHKNELTEKRAAIQRRIENRCGEDDASLADRWDRDGFPWTEEANRILKENFRLDHFRPLQRAAINAVMSKEDAIVILSTGGGKSLCYQLPALLAKDQIHQLRKLGIEAAALNASTSKEEAKQVEDAITNKDSSFRLLYVTPEKLAKSKRMMNKLEKSLSVGFLKLIAIDEVHCCSQWGHDFRTDYAFLNVLKRQFKGVPILGLTATATASVLDDVKEMLGVQAAIVFRAGFNRPNLTYEVRPKPASDDDCAAAIASVINNRFKNESGIVYCLSRNDSEKVAASLKKLGIKAKHYHAHLEPQQRSQVHEKWLADQFQVIVATVAFGMGIDKPDVRFVIHHSLPKSVENYYQVERPLDPQKFSTVCVSLSLPSSAREEEGAEKKKQFQKAKNGLYAFEYLNTDPAYNHPNLIIPNQIRTKCSSEPNHSEPMEYSFRTN